MSDLSKIYLFRMTHRKNIPHILGQGITHINSPNANPNFVPIGDKTLISTRNQRKLTNGRTLGEYIPFYFGVRMPMLYVIQNGFNGVASTPAEDIVYCVTNVEKILSHNLDFVFTDGHAIDFLSTLYSTDDINEIETIIDKTAIDSKFWKSDSDLDLKRRKEAEFLISEDIPTTAIIGFIVFNKNIQDELLSLGIDQSKVAIRPNFYF